MAANNEFQDPAGDGAQRLSSLLLDDVNAVVSVQILNTLRWPAFFSGLIGALLMIREVDLPALVSVPLFLMVSTQDQRLLSCIFAHVHTNCTCLLVFFFSSRKWFLPVCTISLCTCVVSVFACGHAAYCRDAMRKAQRSHASHQRPRMPAYHSLTSCLCTCSPSPCLSACKAKSLCLQQDGADGQAKHLPSRRLSELRDLCERAQMFGLQYLLVHVINVQRDSDVVQATKARLSELIGMLESFEMIKLLSIHDMFMRRLRQLRNTELLELSRGMVLKACLVTLALATPALFNALVVTLDRLAWRRIGSGVSVFMVLALAAPLLPPLSLLVLLALAQSRKKDAYARILKMLQSEQRDDAPQVRLGFSSTLWLACPQLSSVCGLKRLLFTCFAL